MTLILQYMKRSNRFFVLAAVLVVVVLIFGRVAAGFYTDALWFKQLGYASVFWTRFATLAFTKIGAAIFVGVVVLGNLWLVTRQLGPVHVRRRYGNLEISEQIPRRLVGIGMLVAAVLAGWWLANVKFGAGQSINVLTWMHRTPWGAADPLFGKDISFYVFSLPLYYQVVDLLLLTVLWSLILSFMGYALVGNVRLRGNRMEIDPNARMHALLLGAALLVLVGVRMWIGRYAILMNGTGFNGAIGYTDVHARLPAQRIIALLCILAGGSLVYSGIRRVWAPALGAAALLFVAVLGGGALYPSFIQKFRVDPNEFRFEERYIAWNIDFTRRAYGLDKVNRQPYEYHRTEAEPAELSKRLVDIPVWDLEPLQVAYNQLQAFFPYYHFPNVDYDRYPAGDGSKQIAVAVREFLPTGLSENARTWLNLHFDPKYIRGVGAVITPAAVMGHGEPPAWLSNVNPVERSADAPPELVLTDASVFYGETPDGYVVIRKNSGLKSPVTAVPLTSKLRVLAFAWRFADKNLLFTGGLTDGSTLAFRRRITERVRALAPFLAWDADPYAVVSGGHIIWIIDGYSATAAYPIAQRTSITGIGDVRYLHNSVKATIDAATGEVKIYRFDPNDPFIATYAQAFPQLFAAAASMPADLQRHVRYPGLLLHEQAEVYGHYHLSNPDAFYRAEDVWQLPQTADATGGGSQFRSVYQMMTLPGQERDEFVLAAPYIARQRQNMTALLVARNDAPNYGQLQLYELPRNQLIPGPTQVHAIVEQDPTISPQLSLWRQAGSDVTIGHARVVPIGSGFLYVMPLFLSAQGSPIPELQRIIVSDGTRVAMGNSIAEAVAAVFGTPTPGAAPQAAGAAAPGAAAAAAAAITTPALSRRALELLDAADRALRAGDFAGYGARMSELRKFLQQTSSQR